MNLPHDLDAEECVIGACLLSQHAIETVLPMIAPGDFYKPSNGLVFVAISDLHSSGTSVDVMTVTDQLKRMKVEDIGAADLASMQANVPAISSVSRYGMIVARHALARNGVRIASEALNAFSDTATDPGLYVDQLKAELTAIDSPALERPPEDVDLDEFLNRPPEDRKPWVVEGLLRQDWRAMLVGREGEAKSMTTTSIGVCASYGTHPFSHREIPPANVLIIDLENPADVIHERIKWNAEACRTRPRYETERQAYLWHRPGGIDLRKRTDRLALEDILRRRRPNLVILGPLYKAYTRKANENDEQVAAEVQSVLDDLRTRYDFALLMEHHAPKGAAGTIRELVPFGSSLWLRWSELGFALIPQGRDFPSKHLDIKGYRGDRVKHKWPLAIEWGELHHIPFPWKGIYDYSEEF